MNTIKRRLWLVWSAVALFAASLCVILSLDKNEILVRDTVDSIMLDKESGYSIGDCITNFKDNKPSNDIYWGKLDSPDPSRVMYLMNLITEPTLTSVVLGFSIDGQKYVELIMFQVFDEYGTKIVEEFPPDSGSSVVDFCNLLKI